MPALDTNIAFLRELIARKLGTIKKSSDKSLSTIAKNKDSAMKFVQDVLTIIAGAQALREIVVTTLSRELPKIEKEIKDNIKQQLKEFINCGNNPKIPGYLTYTGTGINAELRYTDYFGMFKVAPESKVGVLIYQDPSSGLLSKDMHTFLYSVIQDDITNGGASHDWGSQTMPNDIATIGFYSDTPSAVNMLNVKANQLYSTSKSLTDFNNDYIDSLTLLPTAQMFNQLIDSIFGSVSFNINFPTSWLKKQEEINRIVEKIGDAEEQTIIDDSYFTFSNQELFDIEETARNRSKGIKKFITCNAIDSSVSIDTLTKTTAELDTISTEVEIEKTINTAFKTIEDEITQNVDEENKASVKIEFFKEIFKAIGLFIANTILSPKLALLFQINYKIVYGEQSTEFKGPIEFMNKNRTLFRSIMNNVSATLLAVMMKETSKRLGELMQKNKAADLAESTKLMKNQIISLFGINPSLVKLLNSIKI